MAYVNTIIFQNILSKDEWQNVLTLENKRALNVLFHSHSNPYGLFPLDLQKRLGVMINNSANGTPKINGNEESSNDSSELLYA